MFTCADVAEARSERRPSARTEENFQNPSWRPNMKTFRISKWKVCATLHVSVSKSEMCI